MTYLYQEELDAATPRPLMLFLHGYGQAGGDPREQTLKHGPWSRSNPAVVGELREWLRVAPHIAEPGGEWNSDQLVAVVRDVFARFPDVAPDGVSVVGISRGGWGALDFASSCPADIAVAGTVVFCPEHVDALEAALGRAPVLLFHCDADAVVQVSDKRRKVYQGLRNRSNFHWVRVHPSWTLGEKRHNCWTRVLAERGVYEWFTGLHTDPTYATSRDRWPDFTHLEQARPVSV